MKLMLKMIIPINIFFLSVNVYSYEEFLFYKAGSPESSGREDQNGSILQVLFLFLHVT